MRWLIGIGLIGLIVGILYATVSGPRWLSIADGVMGGGRGVERVADGVPFGSHGQTLDVWRPTGAASRRPVVIFIYGGGWVNGDRAAYAFAARAFARAGFVVVAPDYRKVPGVRFPAFVQDGADALRWVHDHVAEYGGDAGRIAVAGHSAGAYNAVMLAIDPRWLRDVGLAPDTIKAVVGLCGPYDFFPFDSKRSIDAFAGVVDGPATQPIHYARPGLLPMLLVTGSADTQVKPRNAIALAQRLRAAGSPVELRDYSGLSHEDVVMALSVPFRGKAPVLHDSIAFLKGALGKGRVP